MDDATKAANKIDRAKLEGRALGPECPQCGHWHGRPHRASFIRCLSCDHVWRDPATRDRDRIGPDLALAIGAEAQDRVRGGRQMPHEAVRLSYRRDRRDRL